MTVLHGLADEPGNEDGYVVKMTDDDLETPYKIAPGTPVRLESLYEGDNRLLGASFWGSGGSLEALPVTGKGGNVEGSGAF